MSQNSYEVSFSGAIIDGAELAEVKRKMARLFKADAKVVERLFSGKPVVIKRGIDHQTALKYQVAMAKAGAICVVMETPVAVDARPGSTATSGDPGAVSIAPPGSDLVEHERIEPPAIDTSQLNIASVGEDLVEREEVAVSVIDTSAMSLAPVGEELAARKEITPPNLDIRSMTMAEAGSDLLEAQEEVMPPPPDTGHLELEP